MNSTPKEQDGEDGVAAAHGSRPALDQTVLGVAPPPVGASLAATPEAQRPASAEPTAAPSLATPELSSSALVAAPTIAVSDRAEAAPTSAAREPVPVRPPEPQARAAVIANPGSTLPLQTPAAQAALPPPIQVERRAVMPLATGQQERTELSSDYLRAARDSALSQLAVGASPPARDVEPTPVLTPTSPPQPSDSDDEWLRPAPLSRTLDSALGSGTRPSIAPPYDAPGTGSRERQPATVSAAAKGFEPVPVLRAPLAESLSSALGPLAELGSSRNLLLPSTRPLAPVPRGREGSSRWLLLCSVALATVGVVSLGERLWSRYRISRARDLAVSMAAAPTASPPEVAPTQLDAPAGASSTLLANRPAAERAALEGPVRIISATGAQRAAGAATSAGASPESQLAATAGRHVLSGNYAEALPVYQQLQRNYPENTAYAAMARLLGEKLASSHDTLTVTPTVTTPTVTSKSESPKSSSQRGAGAQ